MNPKDERKRKGTTTLLKFFKKIKSEVTDNVVVEDTIENHASVNESVCVPTTCSDAQLGPSGE